jgi:hypothetical protein
MARPVAVCRAGSAQRIAYGPACYLSRLPGWFHFSKHNPSGNGDGLARQLSDCSCIQLPGGPGRGRFMNDGVKEKGGWGSRRRFRPDTLLFGTSALCRGSARVHDSLWKIKAFWLVHKCINRQQNEKGKPLLCTYMYSFDTWLRCDTTWLSVSHHMETSKGGGCVLDRSDMHDRWAAKARSRLEVKVSSRKQGPSAPSTEVTRGFEREGMEPIHAQRAELI